MAATNAAKNRAVRQEALREQLSKQKHVEQVIKNIEKMEEQGAAMESVELQALKAATENRLKLVDKYLPGLKSTEITGEGGGPIQTDSIFEFIPVGSDVSSKED
jgi:hypothetical protein